MIKKGGVKKKSGAEYSNVQDVLEAVFDDLDSGQIKAMAAELDCSREALYQMGSPNYPEKRFPQRHAEVMAQISRDPRIAEYYAGLGGLKVVVIPDLGDYGGSLDEAIRAYIDASSDHFREYISARDPGGPGGSGVTSGEKDSLMRRSVEDMKALISYQEVLVKERPVDE